MPIRCSARSRRRPARWIPHRSRRLLARIGGNFESVLREYRPQLKLMQDTLCPAGTASRSCGLMSEPAGVKVGEGNRLRLTGPVGIGAAAGEAFVMEDADGMPEAQVAWGRLTAAKLDEVLQIRRLALDLTEKTPEIARERGSNLLTQIAATLQDGHSFPACWICASRCGWRC